MKLLNSQVAVVTGASRGIGRSVCLALAKDGVRVIAVARSEKLLEQLVSEATTLQGEVVAAPADVRRSDDAASAVALTMSRYGKIDILVNNAGVEWPKAIDETSDADYEHMLDTNLRGYFRFCRSVVPIMKRQRNGYIVNLASTAGLRGYAGDSVYCATKWGVQGLTDALHEELRPYGIRVCSIAPGSVNTDIAKETWSPPEDPFRAHMLQPEDVARAIIYVVSQPRHVVIEHIVLRPLVELPYSSMLPLDT